MIPPWAKHILSLGKHSKTPPNINAHMAVAVSEGISEMKVQLIGKVLRHWNGIKLFKRPGKWINNQDKYNKSLHFTIYLSLGLILFSVFPAKKL